MSELDQRHRRSAYRTRPTGARLRNACVTIAVDCGCSLGSVCAVDRAIEAPHPVARPPVVERVALAALALLAAVSLFLRFASRSLEATVALSPEFAEAFTQ